MVGSEGNDEIRGADSGTADVLIGVGGNDTLTSFDFDILDELYPGGGFDVCFHNARTSLGPAEHLLLINPATAAPPALPLRRCFHPVEVGSATASRGPHLPK